MEILQACFFLILQLGYIDAQTDPCESTAVSGNSGGTPTIVVTLTEASGADLATNPDNYIADTKINGILNGTSPFTGITLEISKSAGTPNNINVKTQFALESRAITPEYDFSQRAFLRLVQPLDRDGERATTFDDADVIEFQVKCTRLGSTSSSCFLMIVNVQDINDNSPVFSGTPYYVSVNEAKSNSSLPDATELFEIQTARLGYITIKSTLDFEKVKKYVFLISATDQATERSLRRTSTVTMTIDVTDGDDLGPVFDYHGCFRVDNVCFNPTYTTEISPHATAAQLILRAAENQTMIDSVKARDQDTLNARIQMRIVETLPPGYKDKFALVNTTNSGTFYSVVVSQTEPFGSSDIDILKIMIKATELTDNKRFGRAVIDVHINLSNMSSIEKNIVNTCTIKSCSNVASVVGAVLGILFAIVFSILVVLIIKMRKKGGMKEQQTPVQQNKGLSAGNTVESRQSSSEYDEIGVRSPDNPNDDDNDHQYMEPT